MRKVHTHIAFFLLLSGFLSGILSNPVSARQSVAREWNEVLLEAIRNDFARPTVHARNLFHVSAAMYDAWSAYDNISSPYFLGSTQGTRTIPFDGIQVRSDRASDRHTAISYAAYGILKHRFEFSPGAPHSLALFDSLMQALGYDPDFTSTDYSNNDPAALGNYIAEQIIDFGISDGSNELFGYGNLYYLPVNAPLDPVQPGNPDISDPNRWQPLKFGSFIDQSGNQLPTDIPPFLGAEWGKVIPFALREEDRVVRFRDGTDYWIYHDPGPPPYLDTTGTNSSEEFKWTFSLVTVWSSHLDPGDGVIWDTSPASMGNTNWFPQTPEEYRRFYADDGSDPGTGYDLNPVTGEPYTSNLVQRGDYTRILAEFWADGPDSETPPGHWYTILNYVSDHPMLSKKLWGTDDILNDLEWDIKSYFLLGATMHDAAIAAWSIKGWYDYVRPISALRFMTERGQSSDPDLAGYHPLGIPLKEGFIELITEDDSLVTARDSTELVGTIKLRTWRGHFYIDDPDSNTAGVGWVPAGEWWSYQRPTFVTPPFAGYVSGHSTFSRAAAEVLTALTGDPFFPGGMGTFTAEKNDFLVFENGPTETVELQWATYRDASDQTSLSRIWGGIHPPADDIAGRQIGISVAEDAIALTRDYFNGIPFTSTERSTYREETEATLFPNPVQRGIPLRIQMGSASQPAELQIYNVLGQLVFNRTIHSQSVATIHTGSLSAGFYLLRVIQGNIPVTRKLLVID